MCVADQSGEAVVVYRFCWLGVSVQVSSLVWCELHAVMSDTGTSKEVDEEVPLGVECGVKRENPVAERSGPVPKVQRQLESSM